MNTRMTFKIWLEASEKGFEFFKNMVLGRLNLNKVDGLSAALGTWEPDALINVLNDLGEFKNLSDEVQQQVIGRIRSGDGTLGDLIKLMAAGQE